jgi:hypothetical protein
MTGEQAIFNGWSWPPLAILEESTPDFAHVAVEVTHY